jgi:hypothetical protein
MPTRRDMELDVIVVALMIPVLAMFHLWARKHIAVSSNPATADVARVATNII